MVECDLVKKVLFNLPIGIGIGLGGFGGEGGGTKQGVAR